jgi:hypothetical protein
MSGQRGSAAECCTRQVHRQQLADLHDAAACVAVGTGAVVTGVAGLAVAAVCAKGHLCGQLPGTHEKDSLQVVQSKGPNVKYAAA